MYVLQRLAKELAHEGACENAIYPEAVFAQDRCAFPAGMILEGVCNPPLKSTRCMIYYARPWIE